MPYFQQYINKDDTNNLPVITGTAPSNNKQKQSNKKQKRKSTNAGPPKITPSAKLSDLERSQLHIEIYNYFSWLNSELAEMEKTGAGRAKYRRLGISVPGVQNLMTKLENTFRNVGEYRAKRDAEKDDNNNGQGEGGNEAVGDSGNNSEKENMPPPVTLPMLERSLGESLKSCIPAEDIATSNRQSINNTKRSFDTLYERLVAYKEDKGHINIPAKYKDDEGVSVGRFASDLRQRKRELRAIGLEWEPPNPNNATTSKDGNFVTLQVPSGHLGLTLEFRQVSEDSNLTSAVITKISSKCTFKDEIAIGDRLMTIDGVAVTKLEDLEMGKDRKVRMFGIAKLGKQNPRGDMSSCTYLSQERVVSTICICPSINMTAFTFIRTKTDECKTYNYVTLMHCRNASMPLDFTGRQKLRRRVNLGISDSNC